jgi:Holliday junction resolvase RusA-like endonuclease
MIPFMLWNNQQWRRFLVTRPDIDPEIKSKQDHADFDAWLEEQPGAPLDWLC